MEEHQSDNEPELEDILISRRLLHRLWQEESMPGESGDSTSPAGRWPPSGPAGPPAVGGSFESDEDQPNRGPGSQPEAEQEFRPKGRPPVPVLTVLDDGSREKGEEFRIRGEITTIGRTTGTIVIPNDGLVSDPHVEIRRIFAKGHWQWHLHDMGSADGTFVKCIAAYLDATKVAIVGERRFTLRKPPEFAVLNPGHDQAGVATTLDIPDGAWAVLAEVSDKRNALHFPIVLDSVAIGRSGGGADIELDDPLLSPSHATLKRRRDGKVLLEANQSKNGIWVAIAKAQLTTGCFFRCGEQQFRFIVP